MSKRSWEGGYNHVDKKPKTEHQHRPEGRQVKQNQFETNKYEEAYSSLPASTTDKAQVASYAPFKVSAEVPTLPRLSTELAEAPFRHKSTNGYDRNSTASDVSYERLELLGDAYIEVIASRLIYHHLPQLTAGQQSQMRELLVKNETLAEYAILYGFEERLNVPNVKQLALQSQNRGNKGLNKILGDALEAFVAAAVLSDAENGFAVVEKWLTTLWAPKLLEGLKQHKHSSVTVTVDGKADPVTAYNPTAKAELQNKLMSNEAKLEYQTYKDSVELKGAQLGQNWHYIAVYLTGYGYNKQLLGKGEGKNKVEAGNRAAQIAMHGENAGIVQACAQQLIERRAAARQKKSDLPQ